MDDNAKNKQQLIDELNELRQQVVDLQILSLTPREMDQKIDFLAKLQAIYYLGDMISQAKTATEIYENALNAVRITLRADAVAISLFQANGQAYFEVWRGLSENFRQAAAACLPWSSSEQAPPPLFISNIEVAPVASVLRDIILTEGFRTISFIPLIYRKKLIGHLMYAFQQSYQFSEEDLWLTQAIAGHVSFATERKRVELEQRRLLQAEREQRLLAETLGEVILALTSQTRHEAVLDEILRQVQRIISYSTANIMLLEESMLYIARWQGHEDFGDVEHLATLQQPLADFPLDAQVIQTRQAVVVPDTEDNPNWVVNPESAWIRSFIAVPLYLQDRVLGLLRLDSHIPYKFSMSDTERLVSLANAAAIALENVRLHEQARKDLDERMEAERKAFELNRKFLSLQYAGATIAASLDLQFVLSTFMKEMNNLLTVEGCVISEWDQNTNNITVIARQASEEWWPERSLNTNYQLDDVALIKWVLTGRRSEHLILNQPDIDPTDLKYMQTHGMKTLLLLPMEFQNRVIGLVEVMDAQAEREFTIEDIAFTQLLANQAAIAIENARLYAQAKMEIKERMEAENELQRMANRNELLLEAIPDTMFYLNKEGEILDYKICHESSTDAEATKSDITADLWAPDNIPQVLEHIRQALHSRKVQVFEYQRRGLLTSQNFEARLVANGENEVFAIVRNITEQKQAERQLIRNERLAALGQLAAALAHEINNPLQAIQSNLDLILRYPRAMTENEQHLNIIRRQIERMSVITKQMLNFARPHAATRRSVSLLEQVEQVLVLIRKKLEQQQIVITVETEPNLPEVYAVPDQLNQILLNLIINAVESIADDGQINITLYQEPNELVLSVTNNGPAIPDELLSRIFEPFFTTKSEGSGLGLWVSHNLVQQHQGSLTVENVSQDKGVIFTIKLPKISAN